MGGGGDPVLMGQLGELAISNFAVTKKVFDMLTDAKEELELEDVWYGEQELMPRFPCLVVDQRPKRRAFNGTQRWDLVFTVAITVYHSKVVSSGENRMENEEFAYKVEQWFMADKDRLMLDGLVLLGYIISVEPGTIAKRSTMYAVTRLTWQGESREVFNV